MTLRDSLKIFAGITSVVCAAGCANIGTPSGGPRDEDPPRLVRAVPAEGTLDVSKPEITLTFNELVNVKDAFESVVVSPAGRPPRVSTQGRRVIVRFDSLAANTTYTIDFGDAIEDNNEGNKLQNFAYTFSTGPVLDSLRISGRVLGSRDLEPRPGILVGITDNMSDTAFLRTPLLRVAKTDDRGRFVVRGLAPGTYRVFALGDKNSDFMYSSNEEEAAFMDVTVTPGTERVGAVDTTYNKLTGAIDTVTHRERTRYLPNDLLLRTFVSDRAPQYVSRYERPDSMRLFLKMNAASKLLPAMRILGFEDKFPGIVESRAQCDSLTIWLPTELSRLDTVRMAVDYIRNEWNKEPEAKTDTLNFIRKVLPKPKKGRKARKASALDSIASLTTTLAYLSGSTPEVWQPVYIESATPLARLDTTAFRLEVNRDTMWRKASEPLRVYVPDSLQPRRYAVDYPWDYEAKYRLSVDSLAGTDIYGKPTLPLQADFAMRKAGDYSTLTFNITGIPTGAHTFVELLDASDKVVRTADVTSGRAFFPFLLSGKYYARIIEDLNGNGRYDTGDLQTGLQPDLAYYYPKAVNIKKNWDKEEIWDLWSTAIEQQKPTAVLQNKPKTTRRGKSNRNTQADEEDDEEELFDPTANPFDTERNKKRNRSMRNGSRNSY